MIEITIQQPQVAKRTATFDQETVRIGRDPSCDLVLDGEGCSRHHAEIRTAGGLHRIVDLGSTNGIRFGNQPVPELLLFDGASVSIGVCTLTFAIKGVDPGKTAIFRFEDLPPAPPPTQEVVETPIPTSPPSTVAAPELPVAAPKPMTAAPEPPTAAPEPPVAPPAVAAEAANQEQQALFLLVPRGKRVENFKVAPGVEYVIGRSPNADVVLADKKSSLEHARITSRHGRFYLHDLDSSNGTLLRGEPIEQAEIKEGDTFIVGDTPITLSARRFDLSDEAILMDQTQAAFRIPKEAWKGTAHTAAETGDTSSSGFERLQGLSTRRTVVLLVGVAVIVSALVWYFLRTQAPPSGETQAVASTDITGLRVAVRRAERTSLADVISGGCTVKPMASATVSSEVSGRLLALNVSVGSTVAAGSIIARLNETDIRLQIGEARSSVSIEQVDVAREDYERKQRLFDQGVVTRSVLDGSKNNHLTLDAAYRSANARIRRLEEQLAKTSLRAPLGGVVVRTFVSAGELIGPGSPVLEIENQSAVLLELEVSDRDVVRVSLGLPVRATVDAFPGRVFEGVVQTVGTTANPVTKSFTVEAKVDNQDGSLRSGLNAAMDIVVASREGLAAPAEALIDIRDDRATVFEVQDGVAYRRAVTLGRRIDRKVEILEGIEEGALLVVSGQERLNDGDSVVVYGDGA